jgi:magnesium transporter
MEKSALEIRDMIVSQDARGMGRFVEENHPRVVAEGLAQVEPPEIIKALRFIRKDQAIEIFEFFSEETQTAVFDGLARKEMAEFLEEMSPDDRADLVKRLNPDLVENVLALMAQVDREDIRRLASYREGTAGAIMTTDYACLGPELTVAEALEQLRVQAPDRETIYDIYVVDKGRRLLGVVHLKDLIVARPATVKKVEDVVDEAISVRVSDDPIDVARTISKYDMIAVPVVDASGRLVGIVTVDDAMDLLDAEAVDPSATGGKGAASTLGYVERAVWAINRSRGILLIVLAFLLVAIWLLIEAGNENLALATMIVGLPLMVALGVCPGARCAASTIRDLVREHQPLKSIFSNLLDAIRISLPGTVAVLGAFWLVLLWRAGGAGESELVLRMAIGAVLQVLGASLFGGLVAAACHGMNISDEKLVAPIFVTLGDAVGLVLYFALTLQPLRGLISV